MWTLIHLIWVTSRYYLEATKETDGEGREWWNSRKLARLMGYQKYWNFERLMDKVSSFLQQEKGLDLKEHMVEIEEMAQLNNGGYRQVKSVGQLR